ncbi:hypothetical protein ABPG72_006224 [Tetrahymena utriculariae]
MIQISNLLRKLDFNSQPFSFFVQKDQKKRRLKQEVLQYFYNNNFCYLLVLFAILIFWKSNNSQSNYRNVKLNLKISSDFQQKYFWNHLYHLGINFGLIRITNRKRKYEFIDLKLIDCPDDPNFTGYKCIDFSNQPESAKEIFTDPTNLNQFYYSLVFQPCQGLPNCSNQYEIENDIIQATFVFFIKIRVIQFNNQSQQIDEYFLIDIFQFDQNISTFYQYLLQQQVSTLNQVYFFLSSKTRVDITNYRKSTTYYSQQNLLQKAGFTGYEQFFSVQIKFKQLPVFNSHQQQKHQHSFYQYQIFFQLQDLQLKNILNIDQFRKPTIYFQKNSINGLQSNQYLIKKGLNWSQLLRIYGISELYSDLIEIKTAVKLLMSPEQYAAMKFCRYDVSLSGVDSQEYQLEGKKILQNAENINKVYPSLLTSLTSKNLNLDEGNSMQGINQENKKMNSKQKVEGVFSDLKMEPISKKEECEQNFSDDRYSVQSKNNLEEIEEMLTNKQILFSKLQSFIEKIQNKNLSLTQTGMNIYSSLIGYNYQELDSNQLVINYS